MKNVLFIFSKVLAILAIVRASMLLLVNALSFGRIMPFPFMSKVVSVFISWSITTLAVASAVCLLLAGVSLIVRFSDKIRMLIYTQLIIEIALFILPIIISITNHSAIPPSLYFQRVLMNLMPTLIIDLLILLICDAIIKQNISEMGGSSPKR